MYSSSKLVVLSCVAVQDEAVDAAVLVGVTKPSSVAYCHASLRILRDVVAHGATVRKAVESELARSASG